MQSSTIVVLRTLVMLAALVAVPVAALFGGTIWSRLAKVVAVLQEDLDSENDDKQHDPAPAPSLTSTATAPAAMPTAAAATAAANGMVPSPAHHQSAQTSPMQSNPLPAQPLTNTAIPAALMPPGAASTASAPSAELTSKAQLSSPPFWPAEPAAASAGIAQAQAHAPLGGSGKPLSMAANQAAYITRAETTPMPPPPAFPNEPNEPLANRWPQSETGTTQASASPQQTAIERRLQSLGALHYRLETAGTQGELFRFQCKMGLEANPNYVGYFEATNSDSLIAMRQVLEQVESWRAGAVRR
jgi:hypothetical protein